MVGIREIPFSELNATLSTPEWSSGPLYFVGDVGGTNARLGFGKIAPGGKVSLFYVRFEMSKKDVTQLFDFFDEVLKVVSPSVTSRIFSGAVTVPGPVNHGIAGPFNNLRGVAKLADFPTALFPRGRSALLNDLEAGGYGILAISDANAFSEYFSVLWEGTEWKKYEKKQAGEVLGHGSCFIAAPGTGLGTSLIHYNTKTARYGVLPLEMSSVTGVHRRSLGDFNQKLAEFLDHPDTAVSMEDLSVGQSIQLAYLISSNQLAKYPTKKAADAAGLSVGKIAKMAAKGDKHGIKGMLTAYENLMLFLSEAAMTFLPLTCVVMGDNVVRNAFIFNDPELLACLKKAMLSHHMENLKFISRTTVLRQSKEVNLNLLGCLGFGTHLENARSKL